MFQEYLKKIEPRLKELDAEIEKVKAKESGRRPERSPVRFTAQGSYAACLGRLNGE